MMASRSRRTARWRRSQPGGAMRALPSTLSPTAVGRSSARRTATAILEHHHAATRACQGVQPFAHGSGVDERRYVCAAGRALWQTDGNLAVGGFHVKDHDSIPHPCWRTTPLRRTESRRTGVR
jgi:hypothetical protein